MVQIWRWENTYCCFAFSFSRLRKCQWSFMYEAWWSSNSVLVLVKNKTNQLFIILSKYCKLLTSGKYNLVAIFSNTAIAKKKKRKHFQIMSVKKVGLVLDRPLPFVLCLLPSIGPNQFISSLVHSFTEHYHYFFRLISSLTIKLPTIEFMTLALYKLDLCASIW